MKKIWVTGTGGDVGAGIVKCILDGMPKAALLSCDIKPIVPFLDRFEKHFMVPRYDSAEYFSVIKSICLENKVTHFFPTTEPEILLAHQARDFFAEHGIFPVINNAQILDIATSKYKTAMFLKKNGINTPDTYLPEDMPAALEYPLIVKPDFGRGSATVQKVHNPEELERALQSVISPVIQQYIGSADQEYTVGVFSDGRRIQSIAYRRTLGRGGMSVFVEVVKDALLDEIAHRTASLLALKGSINMQLRIHKGSFCIFEINPRISSTVAFRHQMGFQDVIWWLQALSGEPVPTFSGIEAGVVGIKVDSEQIFFPPFSAQG